MESKIESEYEKYMKMLTSSNKNSDLASQSYQNGKDNFLAARTFRSGASNGVQTELAYLQNAPGYIFVNPTTIISKNIASKTISQLPGNDWSGQPSLLFRTPGYIGRN